MHSYTLLAAVAAPLVLAIPAPKPAPVAEPAPAPLPMPQGTVTDPITDLLGSLLQGSLSLGSLSSAVPAVISDTAQLVDSTVPVFGKLKSPQLLWSRLTVG